MNLRKFFWFLAILLIVIIVMRFSVTILLIAARLWYIWLILIGYILIRQHNQKISSRRNSRKTDITDADFTVLDDDEKE